MIVCYRTRGAKRKMSKLVNNPFGTILGVAIVSDHLVPPDKYFCDPKTGTVRVHPDTMPKFMEMMRQRFDDEDGERAFAI